MGVGLQHINTVWYWKDCKRDVVRRAVIKITIKEDKHEICKKMFKCFSN